MSNLRFYRVNDLASTKTSQGILPVSVATIWRWVADGTFPAPIKIGSNTTVWIPEDIDKWIKESIKKDKNPKTKFQNNHEKKFKVHK